MNSFDFKNKRIAPKSENVYFLLDKLKRANYNKLIYEHGECKLAITR